MRKPPFEPRWMWDAWQEPYVAASPLVYFKTGEIVCTSMQPQLEDRHGQYTVGTDNALHNLGVAIDSTQSCGSLWAPDGTELKQAWLDDAGQQHLLIDNDLHVAVRLDCSQRRYWNPEKTEIVSQFRGSQQVEFMPGVPHRFQACYGYIGGPGCWPVGAGKIRAWVPHVAAGLTIEQKRHIRMIEETARAAMKLMDHEATRKNPGTTTYLGAGCPLEVVLAAQSFNDIPAHHHEALYHHGTRRKLIELDWARTRSPLETR